MNATTPQNATLASTLTDAFVAHQSALPGNGDVRQAAAAAFALAGIPTRRTEDYKYIAPDAILKKGFGFRSNPSREFTQTDIDHLRIISSNVCLVFVNGKFSESLSDKHLPEGISISPLHETAQKNYAIHASSELDAFVALNTMFNEGGLAIQIAAEKKVAQNIQLVYISCNELAAIHQPRVLIEAGKTSEATIIETFESIGPVKTFCNAVTEVVVAENARLHHIRIQDEGESGHLVHGVFGNVAAKAVYNTHTFTMSGAWVRNNLQIVMNEPTAEAHLFGLYLPDGNQVVDNHTVVDHRVPHCMSNELYKGLIDGKATAVFNGKFFVRKDAQKTNAYQTNRNILLSDDASMNTKPQLEIYADDVKCSHGTSTGRINEEALFYLQARGIGRESGRKLLMRAFVEEVVNHLEQEEIRTYMDQLLDRKFN
ncbi:MAG: Fe-S cluster assembly protein SufD [Bacteroidia bacterium]